MSQYNTPAANYRTAALDAAVSACAEFLARVLELEREIDGPDPGTHPRECGALRRQSMEVTRAMAVLRKNWRLHT